MQNNTRATIAFLALILLLCSAASGAEAQPEKAPPPPAAKEKKALAVVYDFPSDFDKGAYGRKLAQMLYWKLERIKDIELIAKPDFDEIITETGFAPALDVALEKIRAHAAKNFEADLVFWGRLDKDKNGTYRIRIKLLDLRTDKKKGALHELDKSTGNKFEFKLILEAFLKKFFTLPGKTPNAAYKPVGKNLVKNSSFDKATGGFPDSWSRVDKRDKDSIKVADREDGKGRCLLLDVPRKAARSYGVTVLSGWIPAEESAPYRLRLDVKPGANEIMVIIKGYDDKIEKHRVEVARYEKPIHPKNYKRGTWNRVETDVFTLENKKFDVKWIRIVILAYGATAGTVRFDNVELKKYVLKKPKAKSDEGN